MPRNLINNTLSLYEELFLYEVAGNSNLTPTSSNRRPRFLSLAPGAQSPGSLDGVDGVLQDPASRPEKPQHRLRPNKTRKHRSKDFLKSGADWLKPGEPTKTERRSES